MSANTPERSPETLPIAVASSGDLDSSPPPAPPLTLASLPLGAHLILRCRKDWRDATVVAHMLDCTVLSVGAPSGRTYRVRRPPDSLLLLDGSIPILGEGHWRAGLARYDARW